MDLILNIETSTGVCSVSVSSGSSILACRESVADRSHAALLTIFIEEAMKESGKDFTDLSAVAVSKGPGSYTGLRIGVSTAKGICYGADLPLIAVDTLQAMALGVIRPRNAGPVNGSDEERGNSIDAAKLLAGTGNDKILLCPMIDARRMEVYTAMYDAAGNRVSEITASVIDGSSFSDLPGEKMILFFGDGADKCRGVISHPNALFVPGIYPSAIQMAELSHKAFHEGRFEDVAYFEPFYLKDFITTTPKKNIL